MLIFLFLNLGTLVGVAESLVARCLLLARLSHTSVLIVITIIVVPLYFAFLYKKRYKHVVREFESKSAHQRRARGIGVLLYIRGRKWGQSLFSTLLQAQSCDPHRTFDYDYDSVGVLCDTIKYIITDVGPFQSCLANTAGLAVTVLVKDQQLRVPRQPGYWEQPQKAWPARVPRFASRSTILDPHCGQAGASMTPAF
jgi:hypothetical protein